MKISNKLVQIFFWKILIIVYSVYVQRDPQIRLDRILKLLIQ